MDFHGSGATCNGLHRATLPLGLCSTLLCFIMVGIVSQWLPHVASVPFVLINTRLQHFGSHVNERVDADEAILVVLRAIERETVPFLLDHALHVLLATDGCTAVLDASVQRAPDLLDGFLLVGLRGALHRGHDRLLRSCVRLSRHLGWRPTGSSFRAAVDRSAWASSETKFGYLIEYCMTH